MERKRLDAKTAKMLLPDETLLQIGYGGKWEIAEKRQVEKILDCVVSIRLEEDRLFVINEDGIELWISASREKVRTYNQGAESGDGQY